MATGLGTALRTLTVIPIPGNGEESFGRSLYWYPAAGFLIACAIVVMISILNGGAGFKSPEFSAFAALLAGVLVTGGLHADGLADWGDALGCSRDRNKMLAVMKDPRIGSFGTMALVFGMLGKWIALTLLCEKGNLVWLCASYVVSRLVIVDLAASLPYAREEGAGLPVVREARTRHIMAGALYGSTLLFFIFGFAGLTAAAAGWSAGRLFGLWCRKRAGGITGDLLGAGSELTELTVLYIGVFMAGNARAWLEGI